MPRKNASYLIVILSAALFSFFHPSTAHSNSLRLWVMPNEAMKDINNIDFNKLEGFIKDAAQKGVIIENETKGLARSGYPDWKNVFGYNVAHQKELIRQLSEFVETHPSVEKIYIEFLRWNDAYYRYASLLSGEMQLNPPDVIQVGSTWTADFAKKGLLTPLNGAFDETTFSPTALKSCGIENNDTIYAVPWFMDIRLIYYWKKYFPEGNTSFATFESFEAALKNINGVVPFTMAIGSTWNLMHNLTPWIWGEGGTVIKTTAIPGLYYAPWHSKPFEDAMVYLHSLANQDLLALPQESLDDAELQFINGKYASMLNISNLIGTLTPNWKDDIGIAPMPAGKSGSHSFLGGSHLAITKFSKNKFNESIDLIKHLTSLENEIGYATSSGFFPPNQKAFEQLIIERPELAIFSDAFEGGKSYPSIPEWGEIFENEITRTYLFNLWNDIALGKPLPVVLSTLAGISNQINKRLIQKAIARYSLPAGIILALSLAALAVLIVSWHKKRSYFLDKLEALGNQLQLLEGQKIILEGQIVLLEKHGDTQTNEIQKSREKLVGLESQIDDLTNKFEHVRAKQYKTTSISKFHIKSDGTVIVNDVEVAFENKRQAKHLIEYIVRYANHKQLSIHCIKGFVLFDWTNLREDSNPKRVFDTVISKINMPLKKAGLPPILVSSGRESWQWNVAWDSKLLEQNTDIMAAKRLSNDAREYFYNGDFENAAEKTTDCLHMDPKCIEALSILQEFRIEGLKVSQTKLSSLKNLKRISNQILQKTLSQSSVGLAAAKKHIEGLNRLSKTELAGRLEAEIGTLEAEINCERHTVSNLFADKAGQPLYLKEINNQLSSVCRNISELREKGLKNCDIWAQITQDRYFLTLLSNPHLNDLIHNFYDHTTKEIEDPRLVKLAMILMLNGDECIKELEDTFDGKVFFKIIEKHLRKQFRSLEQEISQFQIN